MTLREARVKFTCLLAQLILKAFDMGYEVALDEAMDRKTAKDPTSDHMAGSLHDIGLAADLILYVDGVYQTTTEAYSDLGEYWESLDREHCKWGGRFRNKDGNHFSFAVPEITANRQ